jgi:hypothetical protein
MDEVGGVRLAESAHRDSPTSLKRFEDGKFSNGSGDNQSVFDTLI